MTTREGLDVKRDCYQEVTAVLASAAVGEVRSVSLRHDYVLVRTMETGVHSGRPRFTVACSTCMVLIHEATTGPQVRIGEHEFDVERSSVLTEAQARALAVEVTRGPSAGDAPGRARSQRTVAMACIVALIAFGWIVLVVAARC